jgi:hypothetical protein
MANKKATKAAELDDSKELRFTVSYPLAAKEYMDELVAHYGTGSRIVRGALWLFMMADEQSQALAATLGSGQKETFADWDDIVDVTSAVVAFDAAARSARKRLSELQGQLAG